MRRDECVGEHSNPSTPAIKNRARETITCLSFHASTQFPHKIEGTFRFGEFLCKIPKKDTLLACKYTNMIDISEEHFERVKESAIELFQQNKKIVSPAFGEIRLTPEGFNHIEWKNKNHKRSQRGAFVRYFCFAHIVHILSNSKLYQEFREDSQSVQIKSK